MLVSDQQGEGGTFEPLYPYIHSRAARHAVYSCLSSRIALPRAERPEGASSQSHSACSAVLVGSPTETTTRRGAPPPRRLGNDGDAYHPSEMELFERARTVRLRSHHDKYLYADEDEVHVIQDRNAASPNARWVVEPVPHSPGVLRLRGRYGRYLSASNEPFLLGGTGRKVLQTLPHRLDSSVEWVPVRDDAGSNAHARAVRLRTRYGNFLRANAGLPPWRNSVTHDVPHRHTGWVVWDVEIFQALPPPTGPDCSSSSAAAETDADAFASSPAPSSSYNNKAPHSSAPLPTSALRPPPPPAHHREENLVPFKGQPAPPPPGYIAPPAPGFYRLEVRTLLTSTDPIITRATISTGSASSLFMHAVDGFLLRAAAQGGGASGPLPHRGQRWGGEAGRGAALLNVQRN